MSDNQYKLPGINNWWIDESITDKDQKETSQSWCSHEWIFYQGFNETYEFCKHCDLKREVVNND